MNAATDVHSGRRRRRGTAAGREEDGTRGAGPSGAKHGSHTQAMSDPAGNEGEEEAAEGEQQHNEEKEENQRLLRGWQERETSTTVRWAWADYVDEEQEPAEESEEKKLEAHRCRAGGAVEPRGEGGRAEEKGPQEGKTERKNTEEKKKRGEKSMKRGCSNKCVKRRGERRRREKGRELRRSAREREKKVRAQGERERQEEEREVEAQREHEGEEKEMTTQGRCVEAKKKEANSTHEDNDVSNRHVT